MTAKQAEQKLLEGMREEGPTLAWNDVLSIPNDAKTWTVQRNRNAETYTRLHAKGIVRAANAEEIAKWYAIYDEQTAIFIHHLQEAVDAGKWKIVHELAETLEWRTGDNHPSKQEAEFITVVQADTALLVNIADADALGTLIAWVRMASKV